MGVMSVSDALSEVRLYRWPAECRFVWRMLLRSPNFSLPNSFLFQQSFHTKKASRIQI